MIDPITHLIGDWATELNVFSIILRIVLSLLLSAYLGFERSTKRHAAGLRTFMVVSLATTISMLLDLYLLNSAQSGLYLISAASIISIAITPALQADSLPMSHQGSLCFPLMSIQIPKKAKIWNGWC